MASANYSSKLKILCLHGYRQNGEVFRVKSGSFRKLLKSHVDFHFVTAPNEAIIEGESDDKDIPEQRAWWFTGEDSTFDAINYFDVSVGLEKSIEVVETTFKENGPFDGVLGFSQGASFLSILCGMQNQGVFQHKIHFAILVAGFKSRCSIHNKYYETKITIPSLHVYAEKDEVIPKEMSEDLIQYFQDPRVGTHESGHRLPVDKKHKQVLTDFLESIGTVNGFKCRVDIMKP